MKEQHIAESDLQQFALREKSLTASEGTHLSQCTHCQQSVETYRSVFTGLMEQPRASFDFDLQALVLPRLEPVATPAARPSLAGYLPALLLFLGLGSAAYFYRGHLLSLFTGVLPAVLWFIVASFAVLFLFLAFEQYRTFERKMNALNSD